MKEPEPFASFRSSVISNEFNYCFHLKDFLEMLTIAQHALSATNQLIEQLFSKVSLCSLAFTMDNFLDTIWYKVNRQVNRILLYSIYGEHSYPVKVGINKRYELIGHINIMTVDLCQKIKENLFDDSLYYSTEEDLFNNLLKIFHLKLFESPIFRKVRTTHYHRFVAKYGK